MNNTSKEQLVSDDSCTCRRGISLLISININKNTNRKNMFINKLLINICTAFVIAGLAMTSAFAVPDGTGTEVAPIGTDSGDRFTVRDDALNEHFVVEGDTGNVGVGITAPDYRLHVSGEIYSDAAIYADQSIYIGAGMMSQQAMDGLGGDLFVTGDAEIDGALYVDGTLYLADGTKITQASDLAAATTLDTAYDNGSSVTVDAADVTWNTSGGNSFIVQDGGVDVLVVNDAIYVDRTIYGSATTGLRFDGNATATNIPDMIIDVNGNVGIGTTVPVYKFDVNHASRMGNPSGSEAQQLLIEGGSGGKDIIRLKRTVGTNAEFGWSLAGGYLAFRDVTNGEFALSLRGDSSEAQVVVGNDAPSGVDVPRRNDGLIRGGNAGADAAVNQIGANLTIATGKGTGTAVPAKIIFQTTDTTASGTALQSLATRMEIMTDQISITNNLSVNNTIYSDESIYIGTGQFSQAAFDGLGGDLFVTGDVEIDGALYIDNSIYLPDGSIISGSQDLGVWTTNGSNIYYNIGNVGIGNTSPGAGLQVGPGSGTADIATATADAFFEGDLEVDNTLYVDQSTGRVGIGESSPLADLHINRPTGTTSLRIDVDDTSNAALRINNSVVGFNFQVNPDSSFDFRDISTNNPVFSIQEGAPSFAIRALTSGIIFNDNNVDYDFRVEGDNSTHALFVEGSSGNVGVGDATPSELLNIGSGDSSQTLGAQSAFITDDLEIDGNIYADSSIYVDNTIYGSATGLKFSGSNELSTDMFIGTDGNMGVGTTSPATKLEVRDQNSGGVGVTLSVNNGFGEADKTLSFAHGSTEMAEITVWGRTLPSFPPYMKFNLYDTNSSSYDEVMRIITTGNVGINETSPKAKLEVDGAIYVDDDAGIAPSNAAVSLATAGDAFFRGDMEIDGALYIDNSIYLADGTIIQGIDDLGGTSTIADILSNGSTASDGQSISIDSIAARDGDGLGLYDDGSNGLFIQDGGNVGVGDATPSELLNIGSGDSSQTLGAQSAFITDDLEIDGNIYADSSIYVDNTIYGSATSGLRFSGNNELSTDMVIDSNGNVGIGNQNPVYRLDVTGSTSDNSTAAVNVENSSGTNLMYLRNDGYLGFGTQSPNYQFHMVGSAPNFVLERYSDNVTSGVFRASKARGSVGAPSAVLADDWLFSFRGGGYNGTGFADAIAITGYAEEDFTGSERGSNIRFETVNLGATVLTEKMRISSLGNIGISASNPRARLHVDGAIYADAGASPSNVAVSLAAAGDAMFGGDVEIDGALYIDNSIYLPDGTIIQGIDDLGGTSTIADILSNGSTASDGQSIIIDSIAARDGDGLGLYDDGSNGLFIQDGGNVGVGDVTPSELFNIGSSDSSQTLGAQSAFITDDLEIDGNIYADSSLYVDNTIYGNAVAGLRFSGDNIADATPDMIIDANGNVGIGLGNVDRKLLVTGDVSSRSVGNFQGSYTFLGQKARGSIGSETVVPDGDALVTFMGQGYDGTSYIDSAYITFNVDGSVSSGIVPSSMSFLTTNALGAISTKMSIRNDGNVGIGISDPVYKLDVGGDIRSDRSIYADESIYIGTGQFSQAAFDGLGGDLFVSGDVEIDGALYVDNAIYLPDGTIINDSSDLGAILVSESASLSVTSSGTSGIDTTADDFLYFGTAQRVLTYEQMKSITLEAPTDTDNMILLRAAYPITITGIDCIVDLAGTGESVVIDVQERDAAGDNPVSVDTVITCDNDGSSDDGDFSNADIDEGDWVSLDIGVVTGTVAQLSVTITFEKTAE